MTRPGELWRFCCVLLDALRYLWHEGPELLTRYLERRIVEMRVWSMDYLLEDDMDGLWSGMLWLARPGDKVDVRLADAVEYAEGKYERPVRLIAYPAAEAYPAEWRGIPLRGDVRVLNNHLFLVMEQHRAGDGVAVSEG